MPCCTDGTWEDIASDVLAEIGSEVRKIEQMSNYQLQRDHDVDVELQQPYLQSTGRTVLEALSQFQGSSHANVTSPLTD